MALVMKVVDGSACPVFICDQCKKLIADVETGVVVYTDYTSSDSEYFTPLFSHWIYWTLKNIKYVPLKRPPFSMPDGSQL